MTDAPTPTPTPALAPLEDIADVERVLATHDLAYLNEHYPNWPEIVEGNAGELPPFIEACSALNLEVVDAFIETCGAELFLTADCFADAYEGNHIALHSAIGNEDSLVGAAFDLVFLILRYVSGRSTVNTPLQDDTTGYDGVARPLDLAAAMESRDAQIVLLLLRAGANPFLCDGEGNTIREAYPGHPKDAVAGTLRCGELAYTGTGGSEAMVHRVRNSTLRRASSSPSPPPLASIA